MKLTSKEVSVLVSGRLEGSDSVVISGAAGLDEASSSDVSFLGNPKYIALLKTTRAGVILVPENAEISEKTVVKVKNPQLAFAKILEILEKEYKPAEIPGVHCSAVVSVKSKVDITASIGPLNVVEEGVQIGAGTKIIAQCYIGKGTSIGNNCLIYPSVTIRENTAIGNNVIIHSGAVIGADGFGFVQTRDGNVKIPQIGCVVIEDDVEIGANSAIDRATTGKTVIGRGTKIDNLVQIAHNVRVGKNSVFASQVGIAGSAVIEDNVTFGGQAGSVGHITVAKGAVVAARGAVTNDVAAGEIVSGYPARPHREALKIQAVINKLPELYEKIKKFLASQKE